jgi:gamma-glutamyltranspeptidase/glutathione hydrolase
MTKADLAIYRVVEREALRTTWEGHDVITMPPPSAGGVMLVETLHMHGKKDLEALGVDTGPWVHVLAETFRGAVADRIRGIGDPAFVKMDVASMVAPARMKARRARIQVGTTTPAEKFSTSEAGTSHMVTVDADGNVVAITSTVNNMFGAKLVTDGGFVLNDELADFADDKTDDRFAMRSGPNAPRGGARPVSSMTPTLVTKVGDVVLALGGSGGTRIATGVTQVLLRCLAHGARPIEAVSAPRFETPPMGGLLLDPGHAKLTDDLVRRGEVVDSSKGNFSAVQAVSIRIAGGGRHMEAAGDPRKGGTGAVQ